MHICLRRCCAFPLPTRCCSECAPPVSVRSHGLCIRLGSQGCIGGRSRGQGLVFQAPCGGNRNEWTPLEAQSCAVPEALSFLNQHPPLKRWAIIYRARGAGERALRGVCALVLCL